MWHPSHTHQDWLDQFFGCDKDATLHELKLSFVTVDGKIQIAFQRLGCQTSTHFSQFSTGEFRRIQLAFFFGFSDALFSSQRVHCNLCVLDEPFSGIDSHGTMKILCALNHFATQAHDDSVFTVSGKLFFLCTVSPLWNFHVHWTKRYVLTERGKMMTLPGSASRKSHKT